MPVTWDYTELAAHYDKRADYSDRCLRALLTALQCHPDACVADIGAGTGKLAKHLATDQRTVYCVEPNAAMRALGQQNVPAGRWLEGTAENTGLATASVEAAFFGSSFNVVDVPAALAEVARIVVPGGGFACLWNHRVLSDPIQATIEGLIKNRLPGYSYGTRREDPTAAIRASGAFGPIQHLEDTFTVCMDRADIVDAWRSHGTLRRQAGDETVFHAIVDEIQDFLRDQPDPVPVSYTTRAWFATLTS